MTELLVKAATVPLGAVLLAAVQLSGTSASAPRVVDDRGSGPPSTGRSPCTSRATAADVTDRNVRPEPPLPPLPPAGGTFVDQAFGKTIMRLTDENDRADNQVGYSYWPTLPSRRARGPSWAASPTSRPA